MIGLCWKLGILGEQDQRILVVNSERNSGFRSDSVPIPVVISEQLFRSEFFYLGKTRYARKIPVNSAGIPIPIPIPDSASEFLKSELTTKLWAPFHKL